MNLYNASNLRDLSIKVSSQNTQRIINESKRYNVFDIFLSHSFSDKNAIKGLYQDLIDRGFTVYVDWIVDPDLDRTNITRNSAERVRRRMASSKSLLLATSTNSKTSKWTPWELGYVDGKAEKCTIIPIQEGSFSEYKGIEYLKLYPHIELKNNQPYVIDTYVQSSESLRSFIS